MKHLIYILRLCAFAFFAISNINAQTTWKEIFFQDFGGNEISDPQFGAIGLSADEVGSSLDYGTDKYPDTYCLVKSSDDNGDDWHKGSDHTYLDDITRGYYMRINPDRPSSQTQLSTVVYKEKLTNICDGVTFRFIVWMANLQQNNLNSGTNPKLGIGIYNDENAQTLVSSDAYKKIELELCSDNNSPSLDWKELLLEFELSNSTGIAYFIVTAIEPEANGFDFAIDDISIEVKQPSVTITSGDFIYQEPVTLNANFDNNGFFSNLNNVTYKWQYSLDGTTFSDIANGTGNYSSDNNCSYTIPSFDKDINNGYYRIIIGETGNLDNPICSLTQNFQINETKNKKKVNICAGEIITVEGATLDASSLNTGDEVAAQNDYTLIINIIEATTKTEPETYICLGETVDGVTYTTEGTITKRDTIQSLVYGCDSLITVYKYIVTGPTQIDKPGIEICQGETVNGKTYNTAGAFKDTTDDGCIKYIQEITVHPTYNLNKTFTICEGTSLNDEVFSTDGVYNRTFNLKSVYGCDSIINATINVTAKIIVDLGDVDLCEGSDTYTFDGKTYSTAGEYNLESNAISIESGCDSITNVHLTIHPKFDNSSNPLDTTICYNSNLFGKIYETPTTGSPILVRDPQTYTTINGCDSIVYYNVTVLQIQLKLAIRSNRSTVCRGEEVEILIQDLYPANTPLEWTPILNGTSTRKTFTPTGDFRCIVKARNEAAQCETTDTAYIYVKDSPELTIDTINQKENIVSYSVTGGTVPYSILLDGNEVETNASGDILNTSIGSHTLTVNDVNNCSDESIFDIIPVPIVPGGFFTPNGDGLNDTWIIEDIDVYPNAKVQIFDREGKLVAEYVGYDNENGWDGTYNNTPVPSTDYWYVINLPAADKQYIGHFSLIR